MKKIIGIILVTLLSLGVVACGPRDSADYIEYSQKESVIGQTDKEDSADDSAEDNKEADDGHNLDGLLMAQNIVVVETRYEVSDEDDKLFSPDIVGSVIENNSGSDIKSVVVAYVAWDESNNPVKFDNGEYVKEVSFGNINFPANGAYGVFNDANEFVTPENNTISQMKSVAVSYVTTTNESWDNPYYAEFKEAYAGKGLED